VSKSKKNIRERFLEHLSELLNNNLISFFPLLIVPFLWRLIIKKGFSFQVNLMFFFFVFILIVFVFFLNNVLITNKKGRHIRRSSKFGLILSIVLLTIFSILLLIWLQAEPKKGTVIIHVKKESSCIPDKLYITRDLYGPFSLLDIRIELKYDSLSNTFSTSEFVRCGKWFMQPEPSDQFNPIEKALFIPNNGAIKEEVRIFFHKKLCDVHFETTDEENNPINGVSFEIDPSPFGYDPNDKTPSFMQLEMGTYKITFHKEGYKDKILTDRTFTVGQMINVLGILKKEIKKPPPLELKPKPTPEPEPVYGEESSTQSQVKPRPKIPLDGRYLKERVEYSYMMKQVKNYLKIKDFKKAEKILLEIISKYKGSPKCNKAQEFLDEIQGIKKESK